MIPAMKSEPITGIDRTFLIEEDKLFILKQRIAEITPKIN